MDLARFEVAVGGRRERIHVEDGPRHPNHQRVSRQRDDIRCRVWFGRCEYAGGFLQRQLGRVTGDERLQRRRVDIRLGGDRLNAALLDCGDELRFERVVQLRARVRPGIGDEFVEHGPRYATAC